MSECSLIFIISFYGEYCIIAKKFITSLKLLPLDNSIG